jgi:integrase
MPNTKRHQHKTPEQGERYIARFKHCVWGYGPYEIGKERGTSRNWYRYWYDDALGEVCRRSLGTADLQKAKDKVIDLAREEGSDPDSAAGDPLLAVLLAQFLEVPEHWDEWSKYARMLQPSLAAVAPTVKVSGLTRGVQIRLMEHLFNERTYKINSIHMLMAVISKALTWAATPDRNDQVRSQHRPRIVLGAAQIAKALDRPAPEADNWHPEPDEMALVLREFADDEPMRRFCLLMLGFGGRPITAWRAKRCQLTWQQFDTHPNGHPFSKNKTHPMLPVPPSILTELWSWPEEHWVALSETTVRARFARVGRKLGLPRLKPSCLRDYVATALRTAEEDYGVDFVEEELREVWQGHRRDTMNRKYGRFPQRYLRKPRMAADAMLRDLNERSGGVLFRQTSAKAEPAPEGAAAHGGKSPVTEVGVFPRDRTDLDSVRAGKTVQVGGIRGCFRQVSAKPVCRLDEIFEPTAGSLIEASGASVFRFVPYAATPDRSPPILLVQDHRHMIED